MQTFKMNHIISRAIAEDTRSRNTENVLKTAFQQKGLFVTQKPVTEFVQFIRNSVQNVLCSI